MAPCWSEAEGVQIWHPPKKARRKEGREEERKIVFASFSRAASRKIAPTGWSIKKAAMREKTMAPAGVREHTKMAPPSFHLQRARQQASAPPPGPML